VARSQMSRTDSQAETRRHLLDAAEQLFELEGFHRTSVGAIARAAGYTTGAIYSNFPRKEDLAVAVLDRSLQADWDSLLVELGARADFEDRLVAVIEWRQRLLVKSEPLGILRLELWLYSLRDAQLRADLVAGQRHLQSSFAGLLTQQAQDLGAALVVSAELLASALLASADGTAVANGLDPESHQSEAFAWTLATLVVASMQPSPIPPDGWTDFLERLLDRARTPG